VYGVAQGQASVAATTAASVPAAAAPGDTEVAVASPPEPGAPSQAAHEAVAQAAPAPVSGALVVDSRPRGAIVTVDGRRRGVTPLRLPDVPAGSHRVRLQMTGYRPIAGTVDVRAGEPARLAVTLEFADDARTNRAPGGVEH
jgi:hypothetical protein